MHAKGDSSQLVGPLFAWMAVSSRQKHGGQLLTAVGMDPNDCIFPIAMAVVEVESLVT